jgi:hypothetical protein
MARQAIIHDRPVPAGRIIGSIHTLMAGFAIQLENVDVILVMKIDNPRRVFERDPLRFRLMALYV